MPKDPVQLTCREHIFSADGSRKHLLRPIARTFLLYNLTSTPSSKRKWNNIALADNAVRGARENYGLVRATEGHRFCYRYVYFSLYISVGPNFCSRQLLDHARFIRYSSKLGPAF